jgi:hypothetical protein
LKDQTQSIDKLRSERQFNKIKTTAPPDTVPKCRRALARAQQAGRTGLITA